MKIKWPWRREKTKGYPPGWTYTQDDGWVNVGWDAGYWQQNLQAPHLGLNETVEACISALSQTTSMCPIFHLEDQPTGEPARRRGSNVERVLKYPNTYQSRTLFFNVAIRQMLLRGNAYAVAIRNSVGTIQELHLVDPVSTRGVFSAEDGSIWYWVAPMTEGPRLEFNEETDFVYPQRDVLHLRLHTDRNPLKGETPITAAGRSIAASSALTGHQANFFSNMARPSGGMFTEEELTPEQMKQLRKAVNDVSQGVNSGKVPVFGHGLKYQSMALTSQDAQLIEAYGMTTEGISRAFRVPLPLINDLRNSTFNNSESMMQWFLASGLGFLLEHIELELGRLFQLPFNERVNFETKALLRSDWKSRMETLGEGVLKGIYSPNEARAVEGLPPAADGDEPRVQQQVVPLSAWDQNQEPANEPVEASAPDFLEKGLSDKVLAVAFDD